MGEIQRHGRFKDLSKLEVFSANDREHPLVGYYADGVWSKNMKNKGKTCYPDIPEIGGVIIDYTRKPDEQDPV